MMNKTKLINFRSTEMDHVELIVLITPATIAHILINEKHSKKILMRIFSLN